jgi:hypothetical protein
MAQLLNGSHYDYVLVGSPSEPGALKRVVLMARASGPNPAPSQPNPQMANQPLQAVPDVDTDASADENNADATPEIPQPEEEPQGEQPPGQNGAPVVKTPEQLLRELQQQQQQQQQQNIPPGAPGQPPQ